MQPWIQLCPAVAPLTDRRRIRSKPFGMWIVWSFFFHLHIPKMSRFRHNLGALLSDNITFRHYLKFIFKNLGKFHQNRRFGEICDDNRENIEDTNFAICLDSFAKFQKSWRNGGILRLETSRRMYIFRSRQEVLVSFFTLPLQWRSIIPTSTWFISSSMKFHPSKY